MGIKGNGAGGKYFVYSGDISSVPIPIDKDVILINHTHPGGTAAASPADRRVLQYLADSGSPQRSSEIIPVGKNYTIKFGS